jgi:hypothetical protein
MAMRNTLAVTSDKGFQDIIVISDCLSLIQRITDRERDRSSIGTVVGDIKHLASGFYSCIFKHYGRDTSSSEPNSCKFYFDVVPDDFQKMLYNNVM